MFRPPLRYRLDFHSSSNCFSKPPHFGNHHHVIRGPDARPGLSHTAQPFPRCIQPFPPPYPPPAPATQRSLNPQTRTALGSLSPRPGSPLTPAAPAAHRNATAVSSDSTARDLSQARRIHILRQLRHHSASCQVSGRGVSPRVALLVQDRMVLVDISATVSKH